MTTATQHIFELVLARPVTLPAGDHPLLAHLWWRKSASDDRLVQVYLDGALYDVAADPSQQEMWVLVDRSRPHRIELLAVPADQAWVAQSSKLTCWEPRVNDVARLRLLRDESLPVETRLRVSVANGLSDEGQMWPGDVPRGGFGAVFGEGAFGFDAAAGPGLGVGELGYGPLGSDGTAWHWQRRDLSAAAHVLQITSEDHTGQTITAPESHETTIDRLADAAQALAVDADFTLHWQ